MEPIILMGTGELIFQMIMKLQGQSHIMRESSKVGFFCIKLWIWNIIALKKYVCLSVDTSVRPSVIPSAKRSFSQKMLLHKVYKLALAN